jgi:hypothetical protein
MVSDRTDSRLTVEVVCCDPKDVIVTLWVSTQVRPARRCLASERAARGWMPEPSDLTTQRRQTHHNRLGFRVQRIELRLGDGRAVCELRLQIGDRRRLRLLRG